MHLGGGVAPHQPVNAAIDGVPLPLPGGTDPSRQVVHLEDRGFIAVHPAIAARRQPGDAAADDDDAPSVVQTIPLSF